MYVKLHRAKVNFDSVKVIDSSFTCSVRPLARYKVHFRYLSLLKLKFVFNLENVLTLEDLQLYCVMFFLQNSLRETYETMHVLLNATYINCTVLSTNPPPLYNIVFILFIIIFLGLTSLHLNRVSKIPSRKGFNLNIDNKYILFKHKKPCMIC